MTFMLLNLVISIAYFHFVFFSFSVMTIYDSLDMVMNLKLPKLNYTLMVELTTNIEDFVFMSVENVHVTDNGITYNGSAIPTTYSSQGNTEVDRVTIDFGYVTVSKR